MNQYIYYVGSEDELLHYGVLGMKWGVRHDKRRAYQKAVKKLNKIKKKRDAAQAAANKHFQKAEKRTYSRFGSKKRVRKSLSAAKSAQYKANKYSAKGKKWYQSMQKVLGKANVKFDSQTKKTGQDFIDTVLKNSQLMYNQMLYDEYKK